MGNESSAEYLEKLKDPEFQKFVAASKEKILLERQRQSMVVTSRQAKQQLVLAGLYSSVSDAISGIEDETERLMVQIYWEDAGEFERNNAQLQLLASQLGLSDQQLDDLFAAAAKL